MPYNYSNTSNIPVLGWNGGGGGDASPYLESPDPTWNMWYQGASPYAGDLAAPNQDYIYTRYGFDPFASLDTMLGTPLEDVLYGRSGSLNAGSRENPESVVYFGATADPGKGGTQNKFSSENAQIVQAALKQFYPNATPEQIQKAAFAALKKNPAGSSYQVTQTPGEIFAGIAKNLGGVTPEAKNWMDANAPAWQERKKQIQTFLNQEKSYRSKGALRDLAAVAAITSPAWGSALFGSGAASSSSPTLANVANAPGMTNLLTPEALLANVQPAIDSSLASVLGISPEIAGAGAGLGATFAANPTTYAEAFGGATPSTLGSGTLGLDSTIATGISPMASGSITGASGMSAITPEALASFGATTGLDVNGLALAAGVGGNGVISSIPSLLDMAKNLVNSGLAGDIAGAIGTLISNNLVDKSVANQFDDVYKRIKDSNPFADDNAIIDSVRNNLTNPDGAKFLHDLFGRSDEFINPYKPQADAGFNTAASLVTNPNQHAGYQLATTAANGLSGLYTDPMSNPIMQAVARLTAENSARRSSAGRGINAGSMPAEMQDALMAALGANFSNIANPMNQSVSTGSNWYQGDTQNATQLGTAASNANTNAANIFNTLAGAGSNAWNAATNAANVGANAVNAHLPAMGQMAQNEINYRIATDPTIRNVADSAKSNTGLNNLIGKGIDFLGTLF